MKRSRWWSCGRQSGDRPCDTLGDMKSQFVFLVMAIPQCIWSCLRQTRPGPRGQQVSWRRDMGSAALLYSASRCQAARSRRNASRSISIQQIGTPVRKRLEGADGLCRTVCGPSGIFHGSGALPVSMAPNVFGTDCRRLPLRRGLDGLERLAGFHPDGQRQARNIILSVTSRTATPTAHSLAAWMPLAPPNEGQRNIPSSSPARPAFAGRDDEHVGVSSWRLTTTALRPYQETLFAIGLGRGRNLVRS